MLRWLFAVYGLVFRLWLVAVVLLALALILFAP